MLIENDGNKFKYKVAVNELMRIVKKNDILFSDFIEYVVNLNIDKKAIEFLKVDEEYNNNNFDKAYIFNKEYFEDVVKQLDIKEIYLQAKEFKDGIIEIWIELYYIGGEEYILINNNKEIDDVYRALYFDEFV